MTGRAIIACLSTLLAVAASAQDLPRFSAEDVFDLEYAGDPRISPDASRIVYARRSNDIMTDRTRSRLWILDADGSHHAPLVADEAQATSPRWSPSGDRVAWVASADGETSLAVLWLESGRWGRIARLPESPSDLAWSPDGRHLAFTMPVKADVEPLAKPRRGPEGSDWSEPVRVFEAARYRRDGAGFIETKHEHVFLVPADGGAPRQLTTGDFDHEGPLAWTADGARIVFSANREADWEYEVLEADLWFVDVSTGALEQLTEQSGAESSPVISPDGRRLAYLHRSSDKVPYRHAVLRVRDVDGGSDRALTADADLSVASPRWQGDRALVGLVDSEGARQVVRFALGGDRTVLTADVGGTTIGRPYLSGEFSVAADGTVAYTRGTAQRPSDVAVVGRRGGARVLTALNEDLLGNRALADVTELRYRSSHDGLEIHGWIMTPPGHDASTPAPLILEIHGGPHAAYGPFFSAELQRYAAEGYVVFYDNHRGSTGYGEEFALALQYLYSSEADFADHMSGIDLLIERGIADPDQLYITGGSAGGIASAYAIGLTDRFRAAAVQKPVINWISKTLSADSYLYQIPYQFPGPPWEELEHYWKRSPLSLVGNVTTPTLLITGEEDQRTPISETEQFYQALKLRRVPAVMVRVPGASHGIAGRPSRMNAKVDNILAWFERYAPGTGGQGAGDDD